MQLQLLFYQGSEWFVDHSLNKRRSPDCLVNLSWSAICIYIYIQECTKDMNKFRTQQYGFRVGRLEELFSENTQSIAHHCTIKIPATKKGTQQVHRTKTNQKFQALLQQYPVHNTITQRNKHVGIKVCSNWIKKIDGCSDKRGFIRIWFQNADRKSLPNSNKHSDYSRLHQISLIRTKYQHGRPYTSIRDQTFLEVSSLS